jgi:hypothetical protein
MTAEIAVLNRSGVALAADSAVTIGPRGDKIWTSADKLFQLSEADPIGIMVYGNADFVGIPWETVIKTYRREHGHASLETVEDHARRFFSYLSKNEVLFPTARQDRSALGLVRLLWLGIREHTRKVIDKEAEKRNGLNENEIPEVVNTSIATFVRLMRARPAIPGMTTALRERIRGRLRVELKRIRDELFDSLPMSSSAKRALLSIAVLMLTRQWLTMGKAGVVFAGFGSREFLPAVHAYEVESMIENVPRVGDVDSSVIDDDMTATIVPFAQQEMVHAFMNGIDPRLLSFMQKSSRDLFVTTFDSVTSLVKTSAPNVATQIDLLRGRLEHLVTALHSDWKAQCQNYWDPVMSNIGTLPKDELAAMAEAFVNLTKFRRRVTNERETVGGPIDVAVITKGDGFIWVKRKHYFDPQLNPRFFTRYQRRSEQ